MPTPRSQQIDLASTPYYHCHSRCVRRSYLCGEDHFTGKNFDHRREWIVRRIKHLSTIFAIQISAYSIMSNHYHLVLYVNLKQAEEWDKDEIIARWQQLFPSNAKKCQTQTPSFLDERVSIWKERLISVSWFMRCLNESIACLANKEDDCTGHFWESRFKSQALLDEGALIAAMAYVDLNPIRAKLALTPETSEYTSIQERIHYLQKQGILKNLSDDFEEKIDQAPQPPMLMPLIDNFQNDDLSTSAIPFSFTEYLTLIDSTGRILKEDKPGAIPDSLVPILTRLNMSELGWITMVNELETQFSYAVGYERMLIVFGKKQNTLLRGKRAAKKIYLAAMV